MNLVLPSHLIPSVVISKSAISPRLWLRKLSVLSPPCVTLTRSNGVLTPFTIASAARLGRCVPNRLHAIAFPLPHGSIATATLPSAALASALFPRPLNTSCGSPSPEHATTTSNAPVSIFSASSAASPRYRVVTTVISIRAASKMGLASRSKMPSAPPGPELGLMRT